jgi:murein DD-endopeptidase MepM/ murein hydrolase activator NlpD
VPLWLAVPIFRGVIDAAGSIWAELMGPDGGIICGIPEEKIMWRYPVNLTVGLICCLGLAGCAAHGVSTATPSSMPSPAASATPVPSASPIPTDVPTPTPAASPTPSFGVCSPLAGVAISDLPAAVSNPYNPPKPGRDEPHAGVDLADRRPGTQIAVAGREVDAVLTGKVAAVIQDRFPFGNAVIVETTLADLPHSFLARLALPTVAPTFAPAGPLSCPAPTIPTGWDFSQPGLYVLYAHMLHGADVAVGDTVGCGEKLGQVGQTGNALVPHLHLEIRAGPGGAHFSSLAHYDDSATAEEMRNYCAWSVSGLFQLADPLGLFR